MKARDLKGPKSVPMTLVADAASGIASVAVVNAADVERARASGSGRETKWSDTHLVRECQQGNEDAWAALLAKYKKLIYSIPIKYGFAADEAGDVFQEVCVELLAELPRLREPRALPKWIIQVTSHKCSRLKRQQQKLVHTEIDDEAVERVSDDRLREEIVRETEREQALRDAVESLPERCQQLVRSLFFESPPRPYQEIANGLGIACGSVGFIRGRCLQRLRKQLEKHGFQ